MNQYGALEKVNRERYLENDVSIAEAISEKEN